MRLTRREWLSLSASAAAGAACGGLPLFAQDSPLRLELLRSAGSPANRVNLIFLSEGFDTKSLRRFEEICADLLRRLEGHAVFAEYWNCVNAYRIMAPSRRAFDGTGDGTLFGARAGGQEDLAVDWRAVDARMPKDTPEKNVVAMIVNSGEGLRSKGGGNLLRGTLATGSNWEIFLHEFGHAFGLLADEYPDGGSVYPPMTLNASASSKTIPWEPMLRRGEKGVGTHKVPGIHRTFWKGDEACIMGQNLDDFGPVCRWGMAMAVRRHARPIEEVSVDPEEIRIRLLPARGHGLRRTFAFRTVADARQLTAATVMHAGNVTRETLSKEKGWLELKTSSKGDEETVVLRHLPPGHNLVVALIEDEHPWIPADPWSICKDVRAWGVTVPEK